MNAPLPSRDENLVHTAIGPFALPPGWVIAQRFNDCVEIDGQLIHRAALCARGPRNEEATGSAASGDGREDPVQRAGFELLERVAILVAETQTTTAHDHDQTVVSTASWRPSRSNGVAIHSSWALACAHAHCELVERDRVLSSWFGDSAPQRLSPAHATGLPGGYEWEITLIPPRAQVSRE